MTNSLAWRIIQTVDAAASAVWCYAVDVKRRFAIMATSNRNTSNTSNTEPTSLKDAAYRFSGALLTGERLAAYVMAQDAGFPDSAQESTLEDLKAGFLLRFAEENPGAWFKRTGEDVYVPKDKDGDIQITPFYALSFSGQAFGKLRAEQPNLHGLVGTVRTAAMDRISDHMSNLRRAARKLLAKNSNTARERAPNKDWADRMTAQFVAMEVSIAKARKRGDTTTPEDAKYKKAVEAFWAALK